MTDIVTIDGPAASGKSTVARRVALSTGRTYVDSGSLYRGITWRLLQIKVSLDLPESIADSVDRMRVEPDFAGGRMTFTVDGLDPGDSIRSAEVSAVVSLVARIPGVRRKVVFLLRNMGGLGKLVVEGRDIGSAVFPDATFKFYLDANPAERARRRQMDGTGESKSDLGSVLKAIQQRDTIDSNRKTDPLVIPDGALVIDTTGLGIEEVVNVILNRLNAK